MNKTNMLFKKAVQNVKEDPMNQNKKHALSIMTVTYSGIDGHDNLGYLEPRNYSNHMSDEQKDNIRELSEEDFNQVLEFIQNHTTNFYHKWDINAPHFAQACEELLYSYR